MLSRSDQVERTVAAGSSRAIAEYVPGVSGAPAAVGHVWTMPSAVIPTTKRHLNPAQRPEEAVPR